MKTLRVAIAGAGYFCQFQLDGWRQIPRIELAGICNRDDTFGGGACDALQAHVVRHLREGAPLENGAADYLANMKIMEAVYASNEQGRRIEIAGYTST